MDGLAHAHRIGSTSPPISPRANLALLRLPQTIERLVTIIVDAVRLRMTRSRMRAVREAHESRLAPEQDDEIEARIEMKSTQTGVNLRGLVRTREEKRGEITAEDQQESQYAEADRECENEVRQASDDSSRGARLAMDEVGKKTEADLLIEPGLLEGLGVQAETLNAGLQVDEESPVEAGSTIDQGPDAE
jgi:hypothetical protein